MSGAQRQSRGGPGQPARTGQGGGFSATGNHSKGTAPLDHEGVLRTSLILPRRAGIIPDICPRGHIHDRETQEVAWVTKPTLTNRVGDLEVHVGEVTARVENLEGWQKKQNGTITRVEEKVDKMIYLHFAELATIVGVAWYLGRCLK